MEAVTRPFRALDLFCGGGGACRGLQMAGFEVVGIDANKRCGKYYPGEFLHGDALRPDVDLDDFDLIWASPPCQAFSYATPKKNREGHPNHVKAVRALLADHPFTIMENVPQAPIRHDALLNGLFVGLPRLARLRAFEMSFFLRFGFDLPSMPKTKRADWENGRMVCVTTSMSSPSHYYPRKRRGLPGRVPNDEAREVMGFDYYLPTRMVGEAVPPPMARFLGRHAMDRLQCLAFEPRSLRRPPLHRRVPPPSTAATAATASP